MGKFGPALVLGLSLWVQAVGAVCAPDSVELRSVSGEVMRFSVELADDEAERAVGLMNRDRMATSSGMLFAYSAPQHVYFWMKNTRIPLDMIFADAAGRVVQVHSNAVPMDESQIDGGQGVTFVLEINGGLAARLGLTKGAVMRTDAIDQSAAVWTCDAP